MNTGKCPKCGAQLANIDGGGCRNYVCGSFNERFSGFHESAYCIKRQRDALLTKVSALEAKVERLTRAGNNIRNVDWQHSDFLGERMSAALIEWDKAKEQP